MKVTKTIYLHAKPDNCAELPDGTTGPGFAFTIFGLEGTDYWGPVVHQQDVTFSLPDDLDIRPQMVAILRKQQADARAKAHAEDTAIEHEIQKLLAIELK